MNKHSYPCSTVRTHVLGARHIAPSRIDQQNGNIVFIMIVCKIRKVGLFGKISLKLKSVVYE